MINNSRKRHSAPFKAISLVLVWAMVCSSLVPVPQVFASQSVKYPAPANLLALTAAFTPALLKGIKVNPNNPLQFNFLIDQGETPLSEHKKETEYQKLIKYFLAALTIPEDELWVNLSPYEKDRIVPEKFGQTEMGRDLLAQDYLLKQLTASLLYPEDELGKKFWDRVYAEAYEKYGHTNIPVNTFNKVWIVPDEAVVFEQGDTAFLVKRHLKVMLEQDYLSEGNGLRTTGNEKPDTSHQPQDTVQNIIKEIIIPAIEKEVNHGEHFANLRQITDSLILATWYKKALKDGLLSKIYVDKTRIEGVDIEDKQAKEKIYAQYLEAFKTGVYNYIKEDYDPATQQVIPRKYFSGGYAVELEGNPLSETIQVVSSPVENGYRYSHQVFQEIQRITEMNRKNRSKMDNVSVSLFEKAENAEQSSFFARILSLQKKTVKAIPSVLFESGIPARRADLTGDIHWPGVKRDVTGEEKTSSPVSGNRALSPVFAPVAAELFNKVAQELNIIVMAWGETNTDAPREIQRKHPVKVQFTYNDRKLVRYDGYYQADNSAQAELGVVRIGSLIFILEDIHKKLSQVLQEELANSVVVLPDFESVEKFDLFSTPLIFDFMNYSVKDFHWIDSGAGQGILALSLLKLGANIVHLFDRDKRALDKAHQLLELNGFKEGENFYVHKGYLQDTEFVEKELKVVSAMARQENQEVAIVSNIGVWPGNYNITNRQSISFVEHIPEASLFLGGGYNFISYYLNRGAVREDIEDLRKYSFEIHQDFVEVIGKKSGIITLSASLNGRLDPAIQRELGEDRLASSSGDGQRLPASSVAGATGYGNASSPVSGNRALSPIFSGVGARVPSAPVKKPINYEKYSLRKLVSSDGKIQVPDSPWENFFNYSEIIRYALYKSFSEIDNGKGKVVLASLHPGGSVAQGDAMPFSDVDGLVVIHTMESQELDKAVEKIDRDLKEKLSKTEMKEPSAQPVWIHIKELNYLKKIYYGKTIFDFENKDEFHKYEKAFYAVHNYKSIFASDINVVRELKRSLDGHKRIFEHQDVRYKKFLKGEFVKDWGELSGEIKTVLWKIHMMVGANALLTSNVDSLAMIEISGHIRRYLQREGYISRNSSNNFKAKWMGSDFLIKETASSPVEKAVGSQQKIDPIKEKMISDMTVKLANAFFAYDRSEVSEILRDLGADFESEEIKKAVEVSKVREAIVRKIWMQYQINHFDVNRKITSDIIDEVLRILEVGDDYRVHLKSEITTEPGKEKGSGREMEFLQQDFSIEILRLPVSSEPAGEGEGGSPLSGTVPKNASSPVEEVFKGQEAITYLKHLQRNDPHSTVFVADDEVPVSEVLALIRSKQKKDILYSPRIIVREEGYVLLENGQRHILSDEIVLNGITRKIEQSRRHLNFARQRYDEGKYSVALTHLSRLLNMQIKDDPDNLKLIAQTKQSIRAVEDILSDNKTSSSPIENENQQQWTLRQIEHLGYNFPEKIWEKTFKKEIWITAGQFSYRVWMEKGLGKIQRYGLKKKQPLGRVRHILPDREFSVGRTEGMYLVNDPYLSENHFNLILSPEEDTGTHITLKDFNSEYGTIIEWEDPWSEEYVFESNLKLLNAAHVFRPVTELNYLPGAEKYAEYSYFMVDKQSGLLRRTGVYYTKSRDYEAMIQIFVLRNSGNLVFEQVHEDFAMPEITLNSIERYNDNKRSVNELITKLKKSPGNSGASSPVVDTVDEAERLFVDFEDWRLSARLRAGDHMEEVLLPDRTGVLPVDSVVRSVMNLLLPNSYDAVMMRKKQEDKDSGYVGKVKVTVTPLKHKIVRLTIEDNGLGMSLDVLEKLMEEEFSTKDEKAREGTRLDGRRGYAATKALFNIKNSQKVYSVSILTKGEDGVARRKLSTSLGGGKFQIKEAKRDEQGTTINIEIRDARVLNDKVGQIFEDVWTTEAVSEESEGGQPSFSPVEKVVDRGQSTEDGKVPILDLVGSLDTSDTEEVASFSPTRRLLARYFQKADDEELISLTTQAPHILIVGGSPHEVEFLAERYPEGHITVVNLGGELLKKIQDAFPLDSDIGSRLTLIRDDATSLNREIFRDQSFDFMFSLIMKPVSIRKDIVEQDSLYYEIVKETHRLMRPGAIIFYPDLKEFYPSAIENGSLIPVPLFSKESTAPFYRVISSPVDASKARDGQRLPASGVAGAAYNAAGIGREVGGIDLNPANIDLQIKRDGHGVPLPMELLDIPNIDIKGFVPVIINITPVTSLPMFLGFDAKSFNELIASTESEPPSDERYPDVPSSEPADARVGKSREKVVRAPAGMRLPRRLDSLVASSQ